MAELWLIRHGETEWSLSGAHTSRTDIPLTDHGRRRAVELKEFLGGKTFAAVLTSPMQRARETCAIAGYGDVATVDEGLREWDYGVYEGKTTPEIRKEHPGWSVWKDEIVGGEPRILAARWIGLPATGGSLFGLGTGSLSVLAFERETRVIKRWNREFE